tara:strand:+ start:75 stop:806 length:732 start_codon:yes stop_codon:yes gene_type:complete
MFKKTEKAFTLLEVLIALTILVSIIFAVSQMLKSSIDIKFALGDKARVTQNLNRIMDKISYDLSHAFLLSTKDDLRTNGKTITSFVIKSSDKGDRLAFTYMGHSPIHKNSKEASLSYVVYEVKEGQESGGVSHLYRGEFPRVPEDFKEDPKMNLFARNVKSIKFTPWNGDGWLKDGWDSTSRETQNRIPQIIKVDIELFANESEEGIDSFTDNVAIDTYSTVVYLPYALDFDEIKDRLSSFRL